MRHFRGGRVGVSGGEAPRVAHVHAQHVRVEAMGAGRVDTREGKNKSSGSRDVEGRERRDLHEDCGDKCSCCGIKKVVAAR